MSRHFRTAAAPIFTATRMLLVFTLLTGGVYPLIILSAGQLLFPYNAGGSLLRDGTQVVGSEYIGQNFESSHYFWGRLSSTPDFPYNSGSSSGSNFGPGNPKLLIAAENRITQLRKFPVPLVDIPVDLVTSSASGLDPHISPAAAEYQIPRVAAARAMKEETVKQLVTEHTELRTLGLFGEPRVHVLRLNRALDQSAKRQIESKD
ncbi:MAG: potassium-transporting ATPase subunit KdpC [Planctomyces sp.]|nr:potassium-transporting ATPase subunit KdpC [Planctomyces sp.]